MNANDFPPDFVSEQQARREAAHESPDSHSFVSIRGSDLLFKNEVYEIVGCAIEVRSSLLTLAEPCRFSLTANERQ
jgi:hypothetical protein